MQYNKRWWDHSTGVASWSGVTKITIQYAHVIVCLQWAPFEKKHGGMGVDIRVLESTSIQRDGPSLDSICVPKTAVSGVRGSKFTTYKLPCKTGNVWHLQDRYYHHLVPSHDSQISRTASPQEAPFPFDALPDAFPGMYVRRSPSGTSHAAHDLRQAKCPRAAVPVSVSV